MYKAKSIVCFCIEVSMICSICFVYVDNFWYNVDHVLLLANALFWKVQIHILFLHIYIMDDFFFFNRIQKRRGIWLCQGPLYYTYRLLTLTAQVCIFWMLWTVYTCTLVVRLLKTLYRKFWMHLTSHPSLMAW